MIEIPLELPAHDLRALQSRLPKTSGVATCYPHFGELLQGAFDVAEGGHRRTTRALVSVHTPYADGSVARVTLDPSRRGKFEPEAGHTGIQVRPPHFRKCEIAARLALDAFELKGMSARLEVTTAVPESAGMGSSTSGVVASIRAVAHAVSVYRGVPIILAPHLQAKLAVAAEHSSDSLMFDCTASTVLFAQRIGKIVRMFNGALPQMRILGFDTGSAGGGFDTDRLPRARYSRDQIAAFGCALAVLERAIAEQSVALAGRVATFSATTSETAMQNPLKKPKFNELLRIKEGTGSAGIVVAHSGTVAGLIFDPTLPDLRTRVAEASTAIARLGFDRLCTFSTPY
ncbi:threonine kinase [Bradyrhizobium macuxiense]|uniref:Threonine kinase n=1 Tax=Bradyrhizobium macuxiense TaxID=1755647 RepID=A0A560KU69_9BRAD|nr:kinase [Bradyrhizobium macuxiense]TWB86806.1 threonine kinase [Bradyrhizobium macuxiense]